MRWMLLVLSFWAGLFVCEAFGVDEPPEPLRPMVAETPPVKAAMVGIRRRLCGGCESSLQPAGLAIEIPAAVSAERKEPVDRTIERTQAGKVQEVEGLADPTWFPLEAVAYLGIKDRAATVERMHKLLGSEHIVSLLVGSTYSMTVCVPSNQANRAKELLNRLIKEHGAHLLIINEHEE